MENVADVYDYLVANDLFTEDELNLVTKVSGWSVETLNKCIYVRYGMHDLEQLIDEDGYLPEFA
jgi:hypothetical protein